MRKMTKIIACILPLMLFGTLFTIIPINAYNDYEYLDVDPQNPEVQQIIRENCKFPLENNMMINLRILYYVIARRFHYDYSFEDHCHQFIPEMLRQNMGVCCDFARLYYTLLVGAGWPAHRIEIVCAPIYILGVPLYWQGVRVWHAWIEIQSPSPEGTILAMSANQSLPQLEGTQVEMAYNNTIHAMPEYTEAEIQNIQTLGFFTRNGWVPIDPTLGVNLYGLIPFLVDAYLVFGYGMFLGTVHMDEVIPYYGPHWVSRRTNPTWDNLTISLNQYEHFNISYLHGIEQWILTFKVTSSVTSTTPIALTIWNPKGQLIDYHWNITDHEYRINFTYQTSPPFPKDLGLYWVCVENPWNQTATVTFNKLSESKMAWLSSEETINQTMYDQYSSYDIGVTDITSAKTIIGQGYTGSINVTMANYGFRTENFNVTVYANTTSVASQNVTLTSGNSTTITSIWNTSSFAYGNYTIWAYAWPVPGETDTTDNNCTDGLILVTIPGDVNGDFKCDGKDIAIISKAYGTRAGEAGYVPNADINDDGRIDGKDIAIASKYFGTHYP